VAGADLTANGNLDISWGADDGDARTVTFSSNMAGSTSLTSDDESITYSLRQDGTLLTATAGSRTVFTVELSKDGQGSYEFTLLDNLDHPTTDTEDDIDLVFNFVATDADGDTASSSFSVKVNDDAPLAESDVDTTENGVATGNVLSNDSLGVDGGELTTVEFANSTGAQNANGSFSVKGDHGTLIIDANGQYSYTYEPEAGDVSLLTKTAFNLGESFIGLDGKFSATEATGVVTSQTNGFGVSGTSGQNTAAPSQINYSGSQSEALAFGFGQQTVTSATVKISNMFQSESGGEAARWYAFDAAGNQVASGVVSANNSGPYENTTQVTWLNNHQAEFTVSNIGSFSTLVFEAIPYSGDGSSLTDNSDYLVSVTAYDVAPSGGGYTDTFTYTVTDGDGDTAQATLTIDGNAITGDALQTIAPVAEDNDESVNENATINGNIIIDDNNDGGAASGRDWDQDTPVANLVISTFDGDALTASKSITTQYGTLTINPDGSYSYSVDQPAANELAFGDTVTETFTYTIVDPNGNTSNQAELNIEILGQNDTPVVSALNAQTNEDTTITFTTADLLAGATDVDATDTLSIENVTLASGDGELVDNGNGTWSYTPAANSDLDAVVNFEVTDGIASVANTMSIDVVAVADSPSLIASVRKAFQDSSEQTIDIFNVLDTDKGFTVKAFGLDGYENTIGKKLAHNTRGFGVNGSASGASVELGSIATASERIEVQFENTVDSISVSFAWLSRVETAAYTFYLDGVAVGYGTTDGLTDTIDGPFTLFPDSGSQFDRVDFTAPLNTTDDYLINSITFERVESYSYELTVESGLTDLDGSEILGAVDISSLPDGVTFDGAYLVSSTPLTDDQINQITASVTSTETSNADQATTIVTAKREFDALDASAETGDLLIKATAASESIIGGAGDDVIFGGAGNDVISGGAGADQFVWSDSDVGTPVLPAVDTINDFNAAEGDVLNLSDLLSDSSENNTITGLEHNGHLELQISNGNNVIQKIDITSIAVANDAAAIDQLNTMLANGAINDGI
jgi:T1SS-143 domain-containing protein